MTFKRRQFFSLTKKSCHRTGQMSPSHPAGVSLDAALQEEIIMEVTLWHLSVTGLSPHSSSTFAPLSCGPERFVFPLWMSCYTIRYPTFCCLNTETWGCKKGKLSWAPKVTLRLPFCCQLDVQYRTLLLVVCATFLRSSVLVAVVPRRATSHCRLIQLLTYRDAWPAATVEWYC